MSTYRGRIEHPEFPDDWEPPSAALTPTPKPKYANPDWVEIRRINRWSWSVRIHSGLHHPMTSNVYGGRVRAERIARERFDRWRRRTSIMEEAYIVKVAEPS